MTNATRFLIASLLSVGVLLVSGCGILALTVVYDLGYAATWPATYRALYGLSATSAFFSLALAVWTTGICFIEGCE